MLDTHQVQSVLEDWQFPVALMPMQTIVRDSDNPFEDGIKNISIPEHMSRVLMRTDTNEPLAVHGSKYQILEHDTVINAMVDSVKESNITTDWDMTVKVIDNGAKMKGVIDFPDLTIEPSVGDYTKFQLTFFNSYDGSWSFIYTAAGLRLWCLNGCTTPDNVAVGKRKHTSNIAVSSEASKIQGAMEAFLGTEQKWKTYMKIQVTDDQAVDMLRATLCKYNQPHGAAIKYNEARFTLLLSQWEKEKAALGSNLWALYNACTWWASHPQVTKRTASPLEVTSRNRHTDVARMMQHKTWKQLEVA